MRTYGVAYLATALVFLGIDSIWLTLTASRLYRPLLGDMLVDGFNLTPAILFYLIYIAGIVYFAIQPAFGTGSAMTATMNGAVFGFVAYATYDLTNQATLKNWPVQITIADLCWGTVLSATAATIGFLIARHFARVA
ncbi:DUF2177 family protein [Mesorhizobium sp. INR15]|uniref:DUF2177 family protein n=1 Tax=Mesorhizobium sp. INR15 TaxID=2654248 RepID=UPI0018964799|nr:DUF2177 family protein [Mesorhizobium sp. INR15]QPC93969.1 DUF2177 family protein [Mesorhizobium sp. INR15]